MQWFSLYYRNSAATAMRFFLQILHFFTLCPTNFAGPVLHEFLQVLLKKSHGGLYKNLSY